MKGAGAGRKGAGPGKNGAGAGTNGAGAAIGAGNNGAGDATACIDLAPVGKLKNGAYRTMGYDLTAGYRWPIPLAWQLAMMARTDRICKKINEYYLFLNLVRVRLLREYYFCTY